MLVYVDWKKVMNEPLLPEMKNVLCSGDPDLLMKFYAAGFKEYFTLEMPKIPDLAETRCRFDCAQYSTFDKIIKEFLLEFPVPYFLFDVVAQLHPDWYKKPREGFPDMCTEENDRLVCGDRFYKSVVRAGCGFVHQPGGIPYVVILNRDFADSVIYPQIRYVFLAIPRFVFRLEPRYSSAFEWEDELVKTPC